MLILTIGYFNLNGITAKKESRRVIGIYPDFVLSGMKLANKYVIPLVILYDYVNNKVCNS